MNTNSNIPRPRSFKIVPVDPTQPMIQSAVETAGVSTEQALLVSRLFQTSAPDIVVPPLTEDIIFFAKRTADARTREAGNTASFIDLFAVVIQELLVASMGAHLERSQPIEESPSFLRAVETVGGWGSLENLRTLVPAKSTAVKGRPNLTLVVS